MYEGETLKTRREITRKTCAFRQAETSSPDKILNYVKNIAKVCIIYLLTVTGNYVLPISKVQKR